MTAASQTTRCPHCKRAFRVTARQLEAAGGMVRCGVCLKAFNASNHMEGLPPQSRPTEVVTAPPAATPENVDWRDSDDFYIDDNFDLSLLEPSGKLKSPGTGGPDTPAGSSEQDSAIQEPNPEPELPVKTGPPASREAADDTPAGEENSDYRLGLNPETLARWQPDADTVISDRGAALSPANRSRRWPWLGGSAIAAMVLAIQLVYFNSLAIAPQSPLRPVTDALCTVLGCPLSSPWDHSAIVTRDLIIRSHPTVPEALLIDAVAVNTAKFSQPYPPLTLLFENLQGRIVAARTFFPEEYLGPSGVPEMMPPDEPILLQLEIADPGRDAVSYRMVIAD